MDMQGHASRVALTTTLLDGGSAKRCTAVLLLSGVSRPSLKKLTMPEPSVYMEFLCTKERAPRIAQIYALQTLHLDRKSLDAKICNWLERLLEPLHIPSPSG